MQTNGASFEVGEFVYAIGSSSPQNPTWNSAAVKWGASVQAFLVGAGAAAPSMDGWFQEQQTPRWPLIMIPY